MLQFALEAVICAVHQPPMIATIQEVSLDVSQVRAREAMCTQNFIFRFPVPSIDLSLRLLSIAS
jgi:hypothetical protein